MKVFESEEYRQTFKSLSVGALEYYVPVYEQFTALIEAWDSARSVAEHPMPGDFPDVLAVHPIGDRWAFAWGPGAPQSDPRAVFAYDPPRGRATRVIMHRVALTHRSAYRA